METLFTKTLFRDDSAIATSLPFFVDGSTNVSHLPILNHWHYLKINIQKEISHDYLEN